MKQLRYCYGLPLLSLLLGCQAAKTDDPMPSLPAPNVYVHYKVANMGKEIFMVDLRTYPHAKPDSLLTQAQYSLAGNWESTMPMRLAKQTDITAALVILNCDAPRRALPVGATLLVELLVNGEVRKRMQFESTAADPAPPVSNAVTLAYTER